MKFKQPTTMASELISHLTERGEVRTYSKGQLIVSEGESSNVMYVINSGQCKALTQDERGRELIFSVLGPGEIFGELFLDGGIRSASVRATAHVECILLDRESTRSMIESHPAFAEFLILKLIERVRHATSLSRGLAMNDVFERTVSLLNRENVMDGGIRMIPASMTQQEIANRVGATREMINHVIVNLISDGFLARDDKRRLSIVRPLPQSR